jgi:hypothetical protein
MLLCAVAADPQQHTFLAGDRIITLDVRFFEPYQGSRLVFYRGEDTQNPICWSGDGQEGECPAHFVGVVTTVTFTVNGATGKLRGKTAIRESVTVTSQSPDLPPRAPIERTQGLVDGAVTDVQAFGYDETDIPEGERETVRKQAKERLWRVCRQELYLNSQKLPFATIIWRYTLDKIQILRVEGNRMQDYEPASEMAGAVSSPHGQTENRERVLRERVAESGARHSQTRRSR